MCLVLSPKVDAASQVCHCVSYSIEGCSLTSCGCSSHVVLVCGYRKSLSLVETLLHLSDAGHYKPVLELFQMPVAKCPDVLVLALLQTTVGWC